MSADFDIVPAGDAVLIVRFAEQIDSAINSRAIYVAQRFSRQWPPGILDVVPTFRSVAVHFDPLKTDQAALLTALEELAGSRPPADSAARPPIEIPVRYGGLLGPDLAEVARYARTSEAEVIRLHSEVIYRVFMLGFMPGFAYMGSVNERIAAPRRQTPRTSVPAGSVGIAAMQTGIYPAETPGGWQLIGRTDVRPFDLSRSSPSLFRAGDLVRFVPLAYS